MGGHARGPLRMVGKAEVKSLVEKLKEMRNIEDELWR